MLRPSLALHFWWLAATVGGLAGPMLGFALIWSATAHGVGTVALVSTAAAVPQVLLVLFGGALGDRHGPRRTLLATTIARILLLAVILVAASGRPGAALLVLRPVHAASPARSRQSMLSTIADGLRAAGALRIWPLLAAVALLSGAVLPTVGVVLPLLARARGWTSAEAGLLDAGWAAGMLAVTLFVSVLGAPRRRTPMIAGPLLAAAGILLLALPVSPALAIAVCAVLGMGTALFTTQIAPLLVRLAPAEQMARFQSLLVLVQLVPPALLNGAFAALATQGGGLVALVLAALMGAGAATLILVTSPVAVARRA